ncbi:class F sortase [Kitasatospora sp. NPDC002040]|uniref:class F sortase n=1 Tax=Kitasatospora sp. NPDC002040 TaxID=3154661 RepID=UPI00331C1D20
MTGLVLTACGIVAVCDHTPLPAHAPTVGIGDLPAYSPPPRPVAGAVAPPAAAVRVAPPTRLRIPCIGVDSALTELQIQEDGHLGTPQDPEVAGWWSRGPAPGGDGTAVIVGHVDSRTGPAVFTGLQALRPGDRIEVNSADGSTISFTVEALRSYGKDQFPDDEVFGDTAGPSLRLITCGGSYDRRLHTYPANLVVFATPTLPGAAQQQPFA